MKHLRKFNENLGSVLTVYAVPGKTSRKGKPLMAVDVKTLTSWEEHDEYPTLTFVLNDTKPFCESCCQLDYGTPFCSTHCNWCLNCMQNMGEDIISDEDATQIWKLAEENS